MYLYIHDVALHSGKYFHVWNKIEARLNNLGIHGRKIKVTPLSNNLQAILRDELGRGVHTVVAVGNDEMFLKLANAVAKYPKIVLAYIPLETSYLSKHLGLSPQELACDILSARVLYNFSVINFNNERYSLAPVEIDFDNLKIAEEKIAWKIKSIEPKYTVMICGDNNLWNDYYKEKFNVDKFLLTKEQVNLFIYKNNKFNWQKPESVDISKLHSKCFFIKNRDESKVFVPKSNYSKKILQVKMDIKSLQVVVGKNRKLG